MLKLFLNPALGWISRDATIGLPKPRRFALPLAVLLGILFGLLGMGGCKKANRDKTEVFTQRLEEAKTKSDNLRKAMRYLKQITPINRDNYIKEVQLELNTWLKNADRSAANYRPTELLRPLPEELLQFVGAENPTKLTFSYWDIEYLYQSRLMNRLSSWIVGFPIRDRLLQPVVAAEAKTLSQLEAIQLEEAYKLFDWTVRNVTLGSGGASVESLVDDPTELSGAGDTIGCDYLPWETLLYSSGDFVERGRAFCSLAMQRGIDAFWIALPATADNGAASQDKLWCVGVLIGGKIYLFEPKLGMPILEPDEFRLATLAETRENDRILRRLDLAGQFDYAVDPGELDRLTFLLDAPPTAVSARMKMLESALLSDERMTVYKDVDSLQTRLKAVVGDSEVRLWRTPLLAQVNAARVRDMLNTMSEESMRYMTVHGIWLINNPVATGRLKHLYGEFENTVDEIGAFKNYMNSRVDELSIDRLPYDPQVQEELGIQRSSNATAEEFQMQIMQAQMIFRRAKVDAAFLLAQLHYDRGTYDSCETFLKDRVLGESGAEPWLPAAHYLLARVHGERQQWDEAEEQLTYSPSPQEAGNRLRLRYLRREIGEDDRGQPADEAGD